MLLPSPTLLQWVAVFLLISAQIAHAQRRTLVLDAEVNRPLTGARIALTSPDGQTRHSADAPPSGVVVWPAVAPGRYARRVLMVGRIWRDDTVLVVSGDATLDTVRLRWPYACLGSCRPDSAFINRVLAARPRWRCAPLQARTAQHRIYWEVELQRREFRRRLRLRPGERVRPLVQVARDSTCARMGDFYANAFYAADSITLVYRGGRRYFVSQTGGPLAVFDDRGRLFTWWMKIEE